MTAPQQAPLSAKAEPPARLRWLRRLTQFSLRTLLIGTTLAAVLCWWFLQPETREEEVAGKHLKLRRQVQIVKNKVRGLANGTEEEAVRMINVGRWRLHNENGDLLVDGRFDNDQKHGPWTIYYPNGRKAAQGIAFRGARTGGWRMWNEEGQLISEVTYKAVEARYAPPPLSPLIYSHGALMGGPMPALKPPQFASQRHGSARSWYASGQLQFEGEYQDDRRAGRWMHYDEQGRVTAEGEYRDDRREGPWQLSDAQSGAVRTEEFIAGRLYEVHQQRLAQIDQRIDSGDARRQAAAIEQLADLKRHGQPRLIELLDHASPPVRRLAARALAPQEELLPDATARLEALIADEDADVARMAMAAVYRERPQQREALFDRLMASLETTDDYDVVRLWIAASIYECDPNRRAEVLQRLAQLACDEVERFGFANWASAAPGSVELLPRVFESEEPAVRLFVLQVIHQITLRGPPIVIDNSTHPTFTRHAVPKDLQPLVERAKSDKSEQVRAAAEQVGSFPASQFGGGMF